MKPTSGSSTAARRAWVSHRGRQAPESTSGQPAGERAGELTAETPCVGRRLRSFDVPTGSERASSFTFILPIRFPTVQTAGPVRWTLDAAGSILSASAKFDIACGGRVLADARPALLMRSALPIHPALPPRPTKEAPCR